MMFLVELGPCRRVDAAAMAVAAKVARTFGRRRAPPPDAPPSSLEALSRRRLGLIRFTPPGA